MINNIETAKNSSTTKHASKQQDRIESVEMERLKSELTIVKKALEEQQTLIKDLDADLKTKCKLLEDKEIQIESLKQTISKYSSKFFTKFLQICQLFKVQLIYQN